MQMPWGQEENIESKKTLKQKNLQEEVIRNSQKKCSTYKSGTRKAFRKQTMSENANNN